MRFSRLRLLACAAVLMSLSLPALAQRVVDGDLQQQMSPAEFKAAGLEKLTPQELAQLNNWLQGKVAALAATAREEAREEGRQEVIVKNRGFHDFGSSDPIETNITDEFRGFAKGRRYVLANKQEWEQTDEATLSGVRKTAPKVIINPGLVGVWYMKVDGYNTRAKVRRVK
ncbi:hypothetical protein [Stenotrophomonas sp.]|uniref:hypothetical protein n=1 Tax=Stenotrophomonas sp. TaxID=69392 RepID=UPI0029B0A21D|nr:hypothetical protein [Stenotrophomonas sp.]MDX3935367.1 hypothetical protein [Stenotrophomonas sp.]